MSRYRSSCSRLVICIWCLEACFGVLYSVFGGTDFICTKVKGKPTLCATLSVILRQMYVLLFNVFFWRFVHNVAAPPISSITATALRATCHDYRTSCGRCIEPFGGKGHMNTVSSVHQYYKMSVVKIRPKEQMRITWKNPNIFIQ